MSDGQNAQLRGHWALKQVKTRFAPEDPYRPMATNLGLRRQLEAFRLRITTNG
jgi:hypothetical protein